MFVSIVRLSIRNVELYPIELTKAAGAFSWGAWVKSRESSGAAIFHSWHAKWTHLRPIFRVLFGFTTCMYLTHTHTQRHIHSKGLISEGVRPYVKTFSIDSRWLYNRSLFAFFWPPKHKHFMATVNILWQFVTYVHLNLSKFAAIWEYHARCLTMPVVIYRRQQRQQRPRLLENGVVTNLVQVFHKHHLCIWSAKG